MKISRSEWAGPLARRLGLAVFLISIFITIASSGFYLYADLKSNIKNIDAQLDGVRDVYLSGISARLWVEDVESLKLDLEGLLNLGPVEYLAVLEDGQTLLEAGRQSAENTIVKTYPLVYEFGDRLHPLGDLVIEASTADAYQQLYENALSLIVLVALQTFLVAGLVLLLVGRRVTRHLATISAFARELGLSSLGQQLVLDRPHKKGKSPDELDILVAALTTMQKQLGQSVAALRDSEENLALTLDCIGDAVIATDREGLVTRMNPVAEKLTGWSATEALGRSVRDIFPIVDAGTLEPVANPVHQALTTGETVTLSNHTTLLAKKSMEYQIADSAAPIRNGNTIIGAILVFHDVTDQYRMRKELRDSEKRLKLHIEQTPLAVIEWDRNLVVTDWNPAAEKIFGYSKEEAVGLNATELIVAPEVELEVENIRLRLLTNQTVTHQVNENTTKSGEILVCEWYNTPLVDEEGQVIGAASLVDDISQRVRAEEKNHEQQLEQQQLLDNLLDAVITVDEDGIVLSFNLSAERLFGYSAKDITGKHFRLIMPPQVASDYQQFLNQSAGGLDVEIIDRAHETLMMDKDGDHFPVRLSVTTASRTGSDKMFFIASIHDLTDEKKTAEQLRRSQKMDALGKLTGGIAHDYNNMLGIVLGYSELLHNALLEQPKLLGYTEQISQAGERGTALTKKLLAFSKQHSIEAVALDVNALLVDQRPLLEKIVTARISVKMELQAQLWPIWVDKGDFEDVLMNLCINAMHAMDASDGVLHIDTSNQSLSTLDAQSLGVVAGDYVRLCVSDTGKGMDKATVEKIFDPFFTTKGELGTGLGLSQVYGFVERSEGAIQVYSQLQTGTRFSLYFPRHTGGAQRGKEFVAADMDLLGGSETIVVVDDEPSLLALARDVLNGQGYKVLCGGNGDEALSLLRNNAVDLVISDVIMPGMDGYELAHKIRVEFPATKILIVSGFDETSHLAQPDQALKSKALVKPYSSQVLLERVRELLDQD
ncbi:MAG: PAS domain S-box protein [Gammaproteobacteria bacterium]|nr:PAS domain S-box protein [Gammaproteobacteria bacterium]MBQ0841162.1 PAS domain S-box protein [Gammaproteobacteria bacterium]